MSMNMFMLHGANMIVIVVMQHNLLVCSCTSSTWLLLI